jgi:hypothetical protein
MHSSRRVACSCYDSDLNTIADWLSEACKHPAGSRDRNQYLTYMIRAIAPQLWKTNTPYYADALQQTWIYFTKFICTTYDPNRGSPVTWLNAYLRYRHQDLVTQGIQQRYHECAIDPRAADTGNFGYTVVKDVAAQEYGSLDLLQQIIDWVESDPEKILRHTRLPKNPQINAQILIRFRLPPETPWKEISDQLNVPIPTLSTFYQRKCLPLLQRFNPNLEE